MYLSLYYHQSHKNQSNLETVTRLKCSAGMAEVEGRKYKNAARCFLQASFEHCNCSDVSYMYCSTYTNDPQEDRQLLLMGAFLFKDILIVIIMYMYWNVFSVIFYKGDDFRGIFVTCTKNYSHSVFIYTLELWICMGSFESIFV